jgi:CRISPR-associated protein Cas2
MLILVSYDISDDRRRTRLAETLKDFGQRVQYSVFECRLDPDQLGQLRRRVLREIDQERDNVRFYRLCATCAGEVEAHGITQVEGDPEVYVL